METVQDPELGSVRGPMVPNLELGTSSFRFRGLKNQNPRDPGQEIPRRFYRDLVATW